MAIGAGPEGIRVNCVSPGSSSTLHERFSTPRSWKDPRQHPLRRLGTAEDCSGHLFLASDKLAGYIHGR
jgi:NAD(P)-dependent dehydrogenase (short-subunit alcohol dehydrogenase family)